MDSPFLGLFLFLEDPMPEKISRFAILVRDMRTPRNATSTRGTRPTCPAPKGLEKKVDDELAVIFGGVQTQGSLL